VPRLWLWLWRSSFQRSEGSHQKLLEWFSKGRSRTAVAPTYSRETNLSNFSLLGPVALASSICSCELKPSAARETCSSNSATSRKYASSMCSGNTERDCLIICGGCISRKPKPVISLPSSFRWTVISSSSKCLSCKRIVPLTA